MPRAGSGELARRPCVATITKFAEEPHNQAVTVAPSAPGGREDVTATGPERRALSGLAPSRPQSAPSARRLLRERAPLTLEPLPAQRA